MFEEIVKFVRGADVKFTHAKFENDLVLVGWQRADKPAAPVADEPEGLEALNKDSLLDMAQEMGIDVDGRSSKAKIIELINAAQEG